MRFLPVGLRTSSESVVVGSFALRDAKISEMGLCADEARGLCHGGVGGREQIRLVHGGGGRGGQGHGGLAECAGGGL